MLVWFQQLASVLRGQRLVAVAGDIKMNWKKKLPVWIVPEHVRFAVIIGLTLYVFHYGLDLLLQRWRISEAATVWDDLAIGILGGLVSLFYMSSVRMNEIFLRAKERITLTKELNYHVRKSLTSIRHAASVEQKADRVRRIEEAVEHIDRVLTELVPTAGKGDAPRYSLATQK
jgi:hypothetical protein